MRTTALVSRPHRRLLAAIAVVSLSIPREPAPAGAAPSGNLCQPPPPVTSPAGAPASPFPLGPVPSDGAISVTLDEIWQAPVEKPTVLALDEAAGVLYALDWRESGTRVVKLSLAGETLGVWGRNPDCFSGGPGSINLPDGMALDPSGDVWISQAAGAGWGLRFPPPPLQRFTPEGALVTYLGIRGAAQGQLDFQRGIALSSFGEIVVADWLNQRVQWLAPDGSVRRVWTERGFYPWHVALERDGSLWVAEYEAGSREFPQGFARIRWFDAAGRLQESWGSLGREPGQFGHARIAPDGNGRVYVGSDKRVQVFTRDGRRLGGFSTSDAPGLVTGVALASYGKLYVSDYTAGAILVFRVEVR